MPDETRQALRGSIPGSAAKSAIDPEAKMRDIMLKHLKGDPTDSVGAVEEAKSYLRANDAMFEELAWPMVEARLKNMAIALQLSHRREDRKEFDDTGEIPKASKKETAPQVRRRKAVLYTNYYQELYGKPFGEFTHDDLVKHMRKRRLLINTNYSEFRYFQLTDEALLKSGKETVRQGVPLKELRRFRKMADAEAEQTMPVAELKQARR